MKDGFNKTIYRYLLALALFTITVGYGDITPKTTFGKIFTTFYVFVGVGIITTFITYNLRRRAEKISKRQ
jgi:hypothetical protein